jgi:hypothetical protein
MASPRLSAYAGIFCLAGSIILFQIALTRVFAILMWHHFTYMVVSIAMLGFGAAGSILTARGEGLKKEDPAGPLAFWSWAYGLAVMLSFCFVTRVRIDTLEIWSDKSNAIALLLFYLIIAVPMLLGGLAIGLALTRLARNVDRLYFVDLLGSALGGAASVWLLGELGSTTTIMIAGGLGTLGGFLFSLGAGWGSRLLAAPALLVAAVVVIGFMGGQSTLKIPAMDWDVPFAPGKDILDLDPELIDSRLPSSTAEVQVSANIPEAAPFIGGDFPLDAQNVAVRYVAQDGTAPTMLFKDAADIEKFPFLKTSQAGSAYVAHAAAGQVAPRVMVSGVGGGVDVMVALAHEAKKVTAVEINDAMIRMVTEDYADYTGGLFIPGAHPRADRVELVRSEGRSHLRHGDEKFDIIQMAGVDSFTALSTGAYTLSESYLYTVEAVKEFYEHLNPGGYVNYSRFIQTYPRRPRETLRLANIARQALEELGVEEPARHIAIFAGREWASTMIKKGPWTEAEIDALQDYGARWGWRGFVYDPLAPAAVSEGFTPMATSEGEVREIVRQYTNQTLASEFDIEFDTEEIGDLMAEAYRISLRGDTRASRLHVAAWVNKHDKEIATNLNLRMQFIRDQAEDLARAAYLEPESDTEESNFLRTQSDFMRVLRATPEERSAFVASYPFDIRPCTDDAPFFFNYYRPDWSIADASEGELANNAKRYHPDVPVGHRVLYLSMIQIAALAFILIILPLRTLKRGGVATPGKFRYFTYFAALGLGFMFIEVALMQKLVIFLGHPTFAISVVLTSLLGFAGVGSLISGRIRHLGRKALFLILLGVLASLALCVLGLNEALPRLLGQPLWARIIISVLLIAPLALMLGMPFPSGIRILERNCPQLLPWGWAINGFLSVLASILCIVASQEIGFTLVFAVAGGLYLLGFLVMKPQLPAETPA